MRNIILLLSIVIGLSSCNSKKSNEYLIEGKIVGNFTGEVYLQKKVDGSFKAIDTAKVENGAFKFQGDIETPDLYYIGIDEARYVSFFNEPSKITIAFNIDSLNSPKVEGSVSDKEYRNYVGMMDAYQSTQIGLYSQYNEAMRNNDTTGSKALETKMDENDKDHKANLIKYINENPASFVSPYIAMRHSYEFELDELKGIAAGFDPKVNTSPFYISLQERITTLESVAVGKVAPDFTMNDPEGNPVTLSNLRGNVVLIDFWASWCGPCRRENPNVVAAYKQYKDSGFNIIGVSLDKDAESWKTAIKADNLTWVHVSDLKYWSNAASTQYGVNSIPSNVLLDKNGVIIARNLTGEDLTNKLKEIFAAV